MKLFRTRFALGLGAVLLVGSAAASDLSKAVAYTLKDAKTSKHVTLASMKGKYKAIYIDMFASWCGPCQLVIPEVIKLHDKLASQGVAFIGLDLSDDWAPMQRDIKLRRINYQVLHDEKKGGIDPLLNAQSIPVTLILDGATLKEKGRWLGYDPSGKATAAQLKVLKSLGVKG